MPAWDNNNDGESIGGSTPLVEPNDASGGGGGGGGDANNNTNTGTPSNNWRQYLPKAYTTNNPGLPVTDVSGLFGGLTGMVEPPRSAPNSGTTSRPNIPPAPPIYFGIGYVVDTNPALSSWPTVTGKAIPQIDTATVRKQATKNEDADCDRESFFYIVDKKGKKPDDAAKEFFDLLNARAGGIFILCPEDGKVLLAKGEDPENVAVTETTSKILAKTINNGIQQGGVGFNGAPAGAAHKVYCRVFEPKNNAANDDTFMEYFNTGVVDEADQRNINSMGAPASARQAIVQAAFMGHFICERFATPNYETVKATMPEAEFLKYHDLGVKRECEIIREMARIRTEFETRTDYAKQFPDKTYPYKSFYYPDERSVVVEVRILVFIKDEDLDEIFWNFVRASQLISHGK